MKKTLVFTIVTFLAAIVLGVVLVMGIYSDIELADNIRKSETRVKDKLIQIRDVQKAYIAVNGRYAGTWDSLKTFLTEGKMYNIERNETIVQRPQSERYKGDSVLVTYDTVSVDNAIDKLFPKADYPKFDPTKLEQIPGKPGKEFTLSVAQEEKTGGLIVHLIEVIDPFPVDKKRKEKNEIRKRKPLRFGSKTEITTSGNWED